jgi:hypothetical protein
VCWLRQACTADSWPRGLWVQLFWC